MPGAVVALDAVQGELDRRLGRYPDLDLTPGVIVGNSGIDEHRDLGPPFWWAATLHARAWLNAQRGHHMTGEVLPLSFGGSRANRNARNCSASVIVTTLLLGCRLRGPHAMARTLTAARDGAYAAQRSALAGRVDASRIRRFPDRGSQASQQMLVKHVTCVAVRDAGPDHPGRH